MGDLTTRAVGGGAPGGGRRSRVRSGLWRAGAATDRGGRDLRDAAVGVGAGGPPPQPTWPTSCRWWWASRRSPPCRRPPTRRSYFYDWPRSRRFHRRVGHARRRHGGPPRAPFFRRGAVVAAFACVPPWRHADALAGGGHRPAGVRPPARRLPRRRGGRPFSRLCPVCHCRQPPVLAAATTGRGADAALSYARRGRAGALPAGGGGPRRGGPGGGGGVLYFDGGPARAHGPGQEGSEAGTSLFLCKHMACRTSWWGVAPPHKVGEVEGGKASA